MKSKLATYTVLVRSAWFALAILVVICCGPVKKLIESHFGSKSITNSSQTSDNKLRTCYREKHEVASFTHNVVNQSPGVGLTLYYVSAFRLSLLLLEESIYSKSQYHPAKTITGIPLYLRIRKLQV